MYWNHVDEVLPGHAIGWVIIRAIHQENEFYFMAYFNHGNWIYFDDDKDYENKMTITHWCIPAPPPSPCHFADVTL